MKIFGMGLVSVIIVIFIGYMIGRNMPSLIPKIAGY